LTYGGLGTLAFIAPDFSTNIFYDNHGSRIKYHLSADKFYNEKRLEQRRDK
jgi:hypothetical protein